jgi:hypothetical protein
MVVCTQGAFLIRVSSLLAIIYLSRAALQPEDD